MRHAAWVLLFCALPAHAWVRTKNSSGVCLWWQTRSHTFQIDSQGTPDAPTAETYDAIRRSFQTWAAVQCTDLVLTEETLSTAPADRLVGYFQNASNHNLVLFRTRACRCTTPGETGCVRIDVQNTVTHEAGHTLGLDHTTDPRATMYASAPSGQTSKRILGADDIAGICAIYPRGAQTATCIQDSPPSGGCGCSPGQSGPGSVLATLAVLLQIARRSRRRPQTAISASKNPASTPLKVHGTRS